MYRVYDSLIFDLSITQKNKNIMANICALTSEQKAHIFHFNCKNAFPIQAEEDTCGVKNLSPLVGWRTCERPYKFYFFSPARAKLWANHQAKTYTLTERVLGNRIGQVWKHCPGFWGSFNTYYPSSEGWEAVLDRDEMVTTTHENPLISLIREIKAGLFTGVGIPEDLLPYRAGNPFPCNIQVANPPLTPIPPGFGG